MVPMKWKILKTSEEKVQEGDLEDDTPKRKSNVNNSAHKNNMNREGGSATEDQD
jgi:hypothetical protein